MFFIGGLATLAGVFGMVLFSLALLFNVSVVMMWLFLELCGLCLIPVFFSGAIGSSMSGLFYYVIFSGVSSSLLLVGMVVPECVFFLLVGLFMKFGVFPLWGWVYRVCCVSNWAVVWGFSTILKASFVIFPMFLVPSHWAGHSLIFLCSLGCLVLSFFFWCLSFGWKGCWCHMMLSSSMVLVSLCVGGCAATSLFSLYFVYVAWASSALLFLSWLEAGNVDFSGGWPSFLFIFLLLSFPFSFSVFYKMSVSFCVFSSSIFLLVGWGVYSFSEQLYLFLHLSALYGGKFGGSRLVFV